MNEIPQGYAERATAPQQVAIASHVWHDVDVLIKQALDTSEDARYDRLAEEDLELTMANMQFPS